MTMPPNDSVTKPINETVRALAGTPMLLALVVLNILIVGVIAYLAKARSDVMQQELHLLLQALSDCARK